MPELSPQPTNTGPDSRIPTVYVTGTNTPPSDVPTSRIYNTRRPVNSIPDLKTPEATSPAYEITVATAEEAVLGQDRILRDDQRHFYGVIDGMGGEGDGDVAAQVVHDSFSDYLINITEKMNANNAVSIMKPAYRFAQTQLAEAAARGEGAPTMGAVASLIYFFENDDGSYGAAIGHVGDTRVMIQAERDSPIIDWTVDECVGRDVTNGLVANWDAYKLDQFTVIKKIPDGARIVIISDGISGDKKEQFLTPHEYEQAFDKPSVQDSANELLRQSKKHDDKSVIVIDIDKISHDPKAASASAAPAKTPAPAANSGNGSLPNKKSDPTSTSPDKKVQIIANYQEKLDQQADKLVNARERYARLSAGRGRRHFSRKYSEKAVLDAEKKYYELRDASIALEARIALTAGMSKEDLLSYGEELAVNDSYELIDALYTKRIMATGRYVYEDGDTEPIKPGTWVGRKAEHFYEWWGKQADAKFFSLATLKKSAAMATIGIVGGLPAAAAGSVLLAPLGLGAGVGAAYKIAKGVMAYHVQKKGDATIDRSDKLDDELRESVDKGNAWNIGRDINRQTKEEVSKNRRRLAYGVGAAAVGGALSEFGLNHLLNNVVGVPKLSLDHPLGFGIGDHQSGGVASHSGGAGHAPTHTPAHPATHGGHHPGHNGGHKPHHQPNGQHWGSRGENVKLGSGNDSVWAEVSKHMDKIGYDGNNNAAVQKVTQAVLNHSGVSWEQARFLPDGFQFRMPPPEVLAELTKTK